MIPFVGGSNQLRRKKADVQRTVNMYPSFIESGDGKANARMFLKSIPGLRTFSVTPAPPPAPETDPYWEYVILHLNGETSVTYDSSPLHRTLGTTGAPSLETDTPMQGTASLDLSGGTVTCVADGFYGNTLAADEFTFRGWLKVLSLPLNAEQRFCYFSGIVGGVSATGELLFSLQNIFGAYALGAAPGSVTVGQKQFFAITRTNNGSGSFYELFLSPDETSAAVLVGTSLEFDETTAQNPAGDLGQVAGYASGSTIQLDDYQLTRFVNRYRGLTSFPVPTGPLLTS